MGRPRRHQNPDKYYLITNRTLSGMFLLLPDDEAKRIMLSCLAKYVAQYNVKLVSAVFMFNHFHLVICFPDSNMTEFMRDLQREIAKRINDHRDERSDPVFPHRFDDKALVDVDALGSATSYVINNPVRHKLVAHPSEWPGILVGLDDLTGERQLTGEWFDADRWYNLSRRKADHDPSEAIVEIPLETHLPERLPGEDEEDRVALLRGRIREDRALFRLGTDGGNTFPGPERLMEADWSDTRPGPSSDSKRFGQRRRRCSAGTVAEFANYERFLDDIETRYETARLAWRAGESAVFPVGTIPPGRSKCVTERQSLPPPID
jgi:REP element-mobilizing transposase RayT